MSVSDSQQRESHTVQVGDHAPDFTLLAQSGVHVHLADLIGTRAIVLFFYPADNTPGCTAEACSFRDNYTIFQESGAEVIGISADSVVSHQSFAAKHGLPFTLLSDPDGSVGKRYGVAKMFGLIPGRVTFVIDRQGIVRQVFSDLFQAKRHVDQALKVIRALGA